MALEFQVMNTTNKKAQQDENIKKLEEENTKLKEENAVTAESVEIWRVWSEELCQTGQKVKDTVSMKERNSIQRRIIKTLKRSAEAKQRQDRRIATKLLSRVMELSGDVAVPGKQRPISQRRSTEKAPTIRSKSNASLASFFHTLRSNRVAYCCHSLKILRFYRRGSPGERLQSFNQD